MAIRNIAIIAHVDHGKTSLVDQLLTQSGTIKQMEDASLIMDSNDQEKERGITIYAKNTAIEYKGERINIMDTPGHADFGSEVERALRMVDNVLLVVDAYEGPMPQTKFVLKKSLAFGMKPLVVINKIDKPTARPDRVVDQLFDLFIELGATDEQADFSVMYASAKDGYAFSDLKDLETARTTKDITPLLDWVLEKVKPTADLSANPFRMQIANLGYDDFVGRLGIGRIEEGSVKTNQQVVVFDKDGKQRKAKVSKVYNTLGVQRIEVAQGVCGDIVTLAGIPDIYVGETVGVEGVEPYEPIKIDEPTLTMDFVVNDSPFAGREGKLVTSRNIAERLSKEMEMNVGLRVEVQGAGSRFAVSGRGELHLGVLIETMRREGFELQVSAPQVIMKQVDGHKHEPIEQVMITVADELSGATIQMLSDRKGMMKNMQSDNGVTSLEFEAPTRGLLGLRGAFTVLTRGDGILTSSFVRYEQYKGEISKRNNGSLISGGGGESMRYAMFNLQDRGQLFVEPATPVYEGMIVGESAKPGDMVVNITKNKQQTSVRTAGKDENMLLAPIKKMGLEEAMGYIGPDEYVEITPKNIRMRKIYLNDSERKVYEKSIGK